MNTMITSLSYLILLGFLLLFPACQKNDTSKIIFLKEDEGKQDLWIMNPDGKEEQQLTDLEFSVFWPDWSPDGENVVFTSYDEGYFGLYIIHKSGKNLRKLDLDVDMPDIPCWSDDSKSIAFMANRADGIQITDMKGKIIRSVAGGDIGGAYQKWSPAGPLLIFESGRDGNPELYSINAVTGEELKRLTDNNQADEWPSFSKDGATIAWSHGGEGAMYTWVMEADGSNQRILTQEVTGGDGFASFSPDGTHLLFTSWSEEEPVIYMVKLDGTDLRKITEGSNPCWSPY